MNKYKSMIIAGFFTVAIIGGNLPVNPVYASPAGESVTQSTSAASSGGGLWETLISLLLGDFATKFFHILPAQTDNSTISSPVKTGDKDVEGFYAEWWDADTASYDSMVNNAKTLNTIIPFWATLHPNGKVTNRGGNDHAGVIKYAHNNNMKALLMVNNSNQGNQDYSIHNVLSDSALRTEAIDNLETAMKKNNLDGINIDFETVPAEDRDNLTAFMRELSARLKPQGYIVGIDVFPKSDESNDIARAYDYSQLAQYADRVMIMAYDNHGTWSDPGPIADIRWVERNLKYALQYIPKEKLYLCIAGYGYDWSSNGVESVDYQPTMDLVNKYNATVKWDDESDSPYFNYTGADGVYHTVWYENSDSLKYKLQLVNKYDIAGIAVWKLGGEDPNFWPVIKNMLSAK